MKEFIVNENEAGQRLDKLIGKYLNLAPKSFIYKMLRKKNITLNGKKALGSEVTFIGDDIKFFLSDETFDKFSKNEFEISDFNLDIIYEDKNIILINKPAGVLSQKAIPEDVSINEHVISYLLKSGQITMEEMNSFRPSVCNRLDRNTTGIIVAGKTLVGLQELSRVFKDRTVEKYYKTIVIGRLANPALIKGWLYKDSETNSVEINQKEEPDSSYIETFYEPLKYFESKNYTLLNVKLITGKTHQIRAHLSSIGHPVLGDSKYGCPPVRGVRYQMLHSYKLVFPEFEGELKNLSGKVFEIPDNLDFIRILKGE